MDAKEYFKEKISLLLEIWSCLPKEKSKSLIDDAFKSVNPKWTITDIGFNQLIYDTAIEIKNS